MVLCYSQLKGLRHIFKGNTDGENNVHYKAIWEQKEGSCPSIGAQTLVPHEIAQRAF